MKIKNVIIVILYVLQLLIVSSCKKFVEIDGPKTSVSSKDIYSTDATAIGALTSLYANMSSGSLKGTSEFSSLSCIAGLSADELALFSGADNLALSALYQNSLVKEQMSGEYWTTTYNRLSLVNSALESLTLSTKLSGEVKKQLLGEARFMRAFYYFYIVNLYGDSPLILGTDYSINGLMSKSSTSKIYEQILLDLKEAETLLSEKYLKGDCVTEYAIGSEERVRPTKWVATSLLARVYLYLNDWTNAEKQSTLVLDNTSQYGLETIDKVFLKNNKEAIWQLQPVNRGYNSMDADTFVLPSGGPSVGYPVYLSQDLVNDFESLDNRKSSWIKDVTVNNFTYYYSYKYKVPVTNVINTPVNEYGTVFRLAEQYLIRAEARAQNGNVSDAIADVDKIRKRAGLPLIREVNPQINQEDLINIILKERRLELFTEWGHRWLDLKRTSKLNSIMKIITPKKGNTSGWKDYQRYYPIPVSELNRNPNLTTTPGY